MYIVATIKYFSVNCLCVFLISVYQSCFCKSLKEETLGEINTKQEQHTNQNLLKQVASNFRHIIVGRECLVIGANTSYKLHHWGQSYNLQYVFFNIVARNLSQETDHNKI
jgi:hypothetical protein